MNDWRTRIWRWVALVNAGGWLIAILFPWRDDGEMKQLEVTLITAGILTIAAAMWFHRKALTPNEGLVWQNRQLKAILDSVRGRKIRAESLLTELLRLYDWRKELAAKMANGEQTEKEQKSDLVKYGREKAAAWDVVREFLGEKS